MSFSAIQCGVVGLGRSGWDIHVHCLKNNSRYAIVGLVDQEAKRLRDAAKELGCIPFESYASLLARPEIDVVVIATPTLQHFSMAKEALEAGKHVVLDKPITSDINEALELRALSEKLKKFVVPFYNFRFSEEYPLIKSLLQDELIGSPFLIKRQVGYFNRRDDWQAFQKNAGGIMNAAAMHHIDQVLQILKEKPLEIWGNLTKVVSAGDAPDHCKFLMRFSSGCMVDVEVSWAEALKGDAWLIYGPRGAIRQRENLVECKWFYEDEVLKNVSRNRVYLAQEEIKWHIKSFELKEDTLLGITPHFYEVLADALYGQGPLPVSLESAITLMENLKKIENSCLKSNFRHDSKTCD